MRIKTTAASDKFLENNNYRYMFVIEVDGIRKAHFLDGESEDATICRDFSDVMSIPALMKSAYDAGKKGEEFVVEECESDDFI